MTVFRKVKSMEIFHLKAQIGLSAFTFEHVRVEKWFGFGNSVFIWLYRSLFIKVTPQNEK